MLGGVLQQLNLYNQKGILVITLYAKTPLGEFLLKNRLKEDYQGDVEILNIFWEFEFELEHKNFVPPLLIYADLLATGDPRNIETARMICEQDYFREWNISL